MGVAASASISIVNDDALWGLIACHHDTPLGLSYETRAACRMLAGDLGRQIKAKKQTERLRERVRLATFEDRLVDLLSDGDLMEKDPSRHMDYIRLMLRGDGVALYHTETIVTAGACPPDDDIKALAAWLMQRGEPVFATDRLAEVYPSGLADIERGSGVLALTLSHDKPWNVFWFRSEQIEVVNWAGNPHKPTDKPDAPLTPRASFAAWSETVRGRSRRWSLAEIEAAGRLRAALIEVRMHRLAEELNAQLMATLLEKEELIRQNAFLIVEVDHRLQNSLMLVSSFLGLQSRQSTDRTLQDAMAEAQRRIGAVSLVHRRLYRDGNKQQIDAALYLGELCHDVIGFIGQDWTEHFAIDIAPLLIPTDRTVTLGLILTELLINANKYAYGGVPGPIRIQLEQDRAAFVLVVSDHGTGMPPDGTKGYGSRLLNSLVGQLGGELTFADNRPGVRVTLRAPIEQKHVPN